MNRAARILLLLSFLSLALGPALFLPGPESALATNYTFPGCGATIQACIASAANGYTIIISAGLYAESPT